MIGKLKVECDWLGWSVRLVTVECVISEVGV